MKTVSFTELRKNFEKLGLEVERERVSILVTRRGRPVIELRPHREQHVEEDKPARE